VSSLERQAFTSAKTTARLGKYTHMQLGLARNTIKRKDRFRPLLFLYALNTFMFRWCVNLPTNMENPHKHRKLIMSLLSTFFSSLIVNLYYTTLIPPEADYGVHWFSYMAIIYFPTTDYHLIYFSPVIEN
jgi:hypothetical protein